MAKRVELTERISSLLKAKLEDENADLSKVAVFECVAASTRKITQKHSAYDGAVMSESVLLQASQWLSGESVPILTMHNGSLLPIGQVLEAQSIPAEGDHHELRALFYLEADSDYADKLDLGIIDEVSVGMMAKHAYCSECDFDYMADGNEFHFWLRECGNEHALGQDGTHLRLSGCASWKELSLVGKGASSKPKIVGRAKQVLSADQFQQLAANGGNPDLAYLLCSSTLAEGQTSKTKPSKEKTMELTQLVSELTAEKAAKLALEATNATLTSQLETSGAELTAANESIATLTAQVAELTDADNEATIKELSEKTVELSDFIQKNWKLALTATGKEVPEEVPSHTEMISQLEAAQTTLATIPRGGISAGADQDNSVNANSMAQASAFNSPS